MTTSRRIAAKALLVLGMGVVSLAMPKSSHAAPRDCISGTYCTYDGCPPDSLCSSCGTYIYLQCEFNWELCPGGIIFYCGYQT